MITQGAPDPPWQVFRGIRILATAMIAGLVLYLVLSVVLIEMDGPLVPSLNAYHTVLLVLVMLLAFVCLVIGKQVMAKAMAAAKNSLNPVPVKLNIYRAAFVINMALLEVPAIITLTVYLLTASFPFLALAAVLLGLMIASWPAAGKVAAQLGLATGEQELLNKN